jgi:hypothetical protein
MRSLAIKTFEPFKIDCALSTRIYPNFFGNIRYQIINKENVPGYVCMTCECHLIINDRSLRFFLILVLMNEQSCIMRREYQKYSLFNILNLIEFEFG